MNQQNQGRLHSFMRSALPSSSVAFCTQMMLFYLTSRRQLLLDRLTHLAENWGGRENGFGLADCCRPRTVDRYPASATTLHFEYQPTVSGGSGWSSSEQHQLQQQKSVKEGKE